MGHSEGGGCKLGNDVEQEHGKREFLLAEVKKLSINQKLNQMSQTHQLCK